MKDFLKGYKEAHAKAREYMRAERAGWVKPGKRTTENHAILIPRREAVEMAEELATNIYAREFYIDWAMELRGSWNDWPEKWTTPWCVENVGAFSAENGARIARTAGQRKTRKSM